MLPLSTLFTLYGFAETKNDSMTKPLILGQQLTLVISTTSMSGNNTSLTASSSMSNFVILKSFDVIIKPPKPQTIKEVVWNPPILNWTKCNTDGASLGNPGQASCGLYRNSSSDFIGGFAINLGVTTALCSKLIVAMVAIEIAYKKRWFSQWLETDSMLVSSAFKSSKIVPWHLQNRWNNACTCFPL